MDLGAIFLLLGVLILVAMYVARPFIVRERRLVSEGHELSVLMAERDRILNALQELDFDHALGKIPDEDYPAQRLILLQKGADVLRQLDEMQPSRAAGTTEDRLEAAIAARRADAGAAQPSTMSDDDLEELIAKRRSASKEKVSGFCPKCGKPVLVTDSFCPNCGRPLK